MGFPLAVFRSWPEAVLANRFNVLERGPASQDQWQRTPNHMPIVVLKKNWQEGTPCLAGRQQSSREEASEGRYCVFLSACGRGCHGLSGSRCVARARLG
jgi:hypothetical protein